MARIIGPLDFMRSEEIARGVLAARRIYERVAAGCVSMVCDSSIACVWAGRPRAGWAGPRWNMKMDDQPENNKY